MTTEEAEPHPATERTTAPQSAYSARQVGIGFLILLIGLAIVFVVPGMLAVL